MSGTTGHAADCQIALDAPCSCGKVEFDAGEIVAVLGGDGRWGAYSADAHNDKTLVFGHGDSEMAAVHDLARILAKREDAIDAGIARERLRDLDGPVENLTDHAAGCELREQLGSCTCGLLTRPGAPPEPTAADLPDGDYAIAELFGHCTMVGRFTEVERFGAKMLALEPIWQSKLLPPVFMGGPSLYRFTPCSKEVAFARQPKELYQLPPTLAATITGAALPAPEHDQDFDEIEEEEDDDGHEG